MLSRLGRVTDLFGLRSKAILCIVGGCFVAPEGSRKRENESESDRSGKASREKKDGERKTEGISFFPFTPPQFLCSYKNTTVLPNLPERIKIKCEKN